MAKNNMKSIRYSDEVAEIIEKIEGNGFNEKFENLVLDFARTIPDRITELEKVETVIRNKKKRLAEISTELEKIEKIKCQYNNFIYQLKQAEINLSKM